MTPVGSCADYIAGGVITLLLCALVQAWRTHQANVEKQRRFDYVMRAIKAVTPLWETAVYQVVEMSKTKIAARCGNQFLNMADGYMMNTNRQHEKQFTAYASVVDRILEAVKQLAPTPAAETRENEEM